MKPRVHCLIAFTALLSAPEVLRADSAIHPTNSYAWAGNAGWVNFRADGINGVVIGEYVCSGYAYAGNFGWIHFGDGAPANGINYQNNSASDFGVNHDGVGNLSGYAYGANIGWVNFGWASTNDANRPRFDLATGQFSGFAYSANVGWLNLGSGYLVTNSVRTTDADGDGIADEWEMQHFGNLTTTTPSSDADGDGSSDLQEYLAATDPLNLASSFRVQSQAFTASLTQATIQFSTNATRRYRIMISPDLLMWSDSELGEFAPDSGLSTTRVITFPSGPQKFFRVIASKPLQP